MVKIMEKDIKRKIDLLNILIEEKRWFKLLELEKELECSSKTIRKDISIINDLLPQNIVICSKRKRCKVIFTPRSVYL